MQTNKFLSFLFFIVNVTFALGGPLYMSKLEVNNAQCEFERVPVPLYHIYDTIYNDHIYTASVAEMEAELKTPVFRGEGVAGSVFAEELIGIVPLYRLYNNVTIDHFYTCDSSEITLVQESGYQLQEIVGYVLAEAVCEGMPFYRFRHQQTGKHFYALSEDEFQSAAGEGYAYEGIIGYVLPPYTPASA